MTVKEYIELYKNNEDTPKYYDKIVKYYTVCQEAGRVCNHWAELGVDTKFEWEENASFDSEKSKGLNDYTRMIHQYLMEFDGDLFEYINTYFKTILFYDDLRKDNEMRPRKKNKELLSQLKLFLDEPNFFDDQAVALTFIRLCSYLQILKENDMLKKRKPRLYKSVCLTMKKLVNMINTMGYDIFEFANYIDETQRYGIATNKDGEITYYIK